MIPNATITAYGRKTGTRGDGRPVLTAVDVSPIFHAEVSDPSASAVRNATHAGRKVDRLVGVMSNRLRAIGLTPAPGDRLQLTLDNGAGQAENYVVTHVSNPTTRNTPMIASAVSLQLAQVDDGITIPEVE